MIFDNVNLTLYLKKCFKDTFQSDGPDEGGLRVRVHRVRVFLGLVLLFVFAFSRSSFITQRFSHAQKRNNDFRTETKNGLARKTHMISAEITVFGPFQHQ
jgi:hypothetical protein